MNSQSHKINSPDMIYQIVSSLLITFKHPTLKKSLNDLGALHHIAMINEKLQIEIKMPFAWGRGFEKLKEKTSSELLRITKTKEIEWRINHDIATLKRVKNYPGINGIKNIIAITSGKGGVGKSSTAVNMALALVNEGVRVGILDADIYGPSVPTMLGANTQQPTSPDGKHMSPIILHGLATNSIGYLAKEDNAIIWRGPMASKALIQLLNDTLWPELDYLFLDMPPGTGDIQLALSKNIPVTGIIVITTPQNIALIDACKCIMMFKKVGIPVIGIVENMSLHICRNCGYSEEIFGSGGAKFLAKKYHIPLLGELPLHTSLREDLDIGKPTVVRRPKSTFTTIYRDIAGEVAAQLYWQGEVIPDEISFRMF